MIADCQYDKDIKKQFMRQNAVGSSSHMLVCQMLVIKSNAGKEILICTSCGKNPTVQVILLPNLWMCSLASFIPELY